MIDKQSNRRALIWMAVALAAAAWAMVHLGSATGQTTFRLAGEALLAIVGVLGNLILLMHGLASRRSSSAADLLSNH